MGVGRVEDGICVWDTDDISEDPCEKLVKIWQICRVQGEKGISLTGLLSCTIDSMEIGGREGGKTRDDTGTLGQGWNSKGRDN